MSKDKKDSSLLPTTAEDYIKAVMKSVRHNRKVRNTVFSELTDHFDNALSCCHSDDEKNKAVDDLIAEFGEPKMLGILIRRGKKRCRPLWRKVVSAALYSMLTFMVVSVIYVFWFISGKPNPEINYFSKLNDSVRPEVRDGDNAWTYYERAINMYVEPDDQMAEILSIVNKAESGSPVFSQLSKEQRLEVSKWIATNEEAWKEFQRAGDKLYCYREYNTGQGDGGMLLAILLDHLTPIRYISKDVGLWRVRIALAEGDIEGAVDGCLTLLKVGKHWQGKGTLIEQLVGMAINDLAMNQLFRVVDGNVLSKGQLLDLKQRVSAVYMDGYPKIDVSAERCVFLDTVQYSFTNGGPGGGHLIPRALSDLIDINEPNYEYPWTVAGSGLLHAGRDETIKTGMRLYDELVCSGTLTPYQKEHQDVSENQLLDELSRVKHIFVLTMMPALGRCHEIRYRKKANHEALLAVLAIKLYNLENGKYPCGLDELVADGYLDFVPDDPYSQDGLVYKEIGDSFTLYSVGCDYNDNGGEVYKDSDGNTRLWESNGGDAVFWPVQ